MAAAGSCPAGGQDLVFIAQPRGRDSDSRSCCFLCSEQRPPPPAPPHRRANTASPPPFPPEKGVAGPYGLKWQIEK